MEFHKNTADMKDQVKRVRREKSKALARLSVQSSSWKLPLASFLQISAMFMFVYMCVGAHMVQAAAYIDTPRACGKIWKTHAQTKRKVHIAVDTELH